VDAARALGLMIPGQLSGYSDGSPTFIGKFAGSSLSAIDLIR